jgi:hypothetical protein
VNSGVGCHLCLYTGCDRNPTTGSRLAPVVSRGPGFIQRAVLPHLDRVGWAVSLLDVALLLSCSGDDPTPQPTRVWVEAARRSLKRLERDGLLRSSLDDNVYGFPVGPGGGAPLYEPAHGSKTSPQTSHERSSRFAFPPARSTGARPHL